MIEENTVIVVDTSNYYQPSYFERVPFKAKVLESYSGNYLIKSLVTKKEYEVYEWQLLEDLTIEEIKNILDITKL